MRDTRKAEFNEKMARYVRIRVSGLHKKESCFFAGFFKAVAAVAMISLAGVGLHVLAGQPQGPFANGQAWERVCP